MAKENSLMNRIWEVLYPSRITCIICDDELTHDCKGSICGNCYEKLSKSLEHVCERCGESLDSLANFCLNCKKSSKRYFKKARAPFLYDGEIKSLIHNLKYNNKQYIGEYLSEFLVEEYKKNNFDVDFIVPIPLSQKRLKQRGYNQSLLLCKKFETELNLCVNTTNLVRVVDTPTQTALTKDERKHNLERAFKVVDKKLFRDKKILIIDDVYTTGATMEEASKTLIESGASEVYCLSVAHTVPPHMRKDKEKED